MAEQLLIGSLVAAERPQFEVAWIRADMIPQHRPLSVHLNRAFAAYNIFQCFRVIRAYRIEQSITIRERMIGYRRELHE